MILLAVLFVMFQAVFTWAKAPMDWIDSAMSSLGSFTTSHLPAGPLASLLADGVIAGAGSVLVFLPQIVILFFFILALEDSGYLPRAAYLLDRLMGFVGLSGRAFIPLLSSHAVPSPASWRRAPSQLARPADHHHDRPADELLGAAAGVFPAGRRADTGAAHRALQPAGAGDFLACTVPASSRHLRWRCC